MNHLRCRWWATLAVALLPTVAWSSDRNPMPPPEASASAASEEQATAQRTRSEEEAIAAVEGSEVRAYTRDDGTKITEYARQGRVYMIKVKPAGDLPAYYLYDERGNGQFSRRLPGSYRGVVPPQWVVKEF